MLSGLAWLSFQIHLVFVSIFSKFLGLCLLGELFCSPALFHFLQLFCQGSPESRLPFDIQSLLLFVLLQACSNLVLFSSVAA